MLQRSATICPPARLATLSAAVLSASLSMTSGVHAEGTDLFTLSAAATVLQDSNLFRLPSNANLPALIGSDSAAEQISITSVGVKVSKDYSLQRVELDLNLANYHYQNFNFLNNTTNNYSAAWRWSVTPRLRGNLTTDRRETLNDFVDVSSYQQRNQRVNVTTRLDAVYGLGGAWRLAAGAEEASQTNPQNQTAEADTVSRSLDAGVRYVYPSDSQWAYTLRTVKGSYRLSASQVGVMDRSFEQVDHEVSLRWIIDGKSTANLRLVSQNRTHPQFASRDFSGLGASANYNVSITGKTSVAFGLSRELGSYQSGFSNYTQTDRLSVAPSWAITAKTLLRMSYGYTKRDYLGAPNALLANSVDRSDILRDTMLSLDWQPQVHLTLSAALQDSRRSVNLPNLDYQSTTASVSAQISF